MGQDSLPYPLMEQHGAGTLQRDLLVAGEGRGWAAARREPLPTGLVGALATRGGACAKDAALGKSMQIPLCLLQSWHCPGRLRARGWAGSWQASRDELTCG